MKNNSVREDPAAGQRILLVDDEEPFLRSAAMVLRSAGFRVGTASRGSEALALLSAARDAGDEYHLVITDLHMPVMSGIELIDEIRRRNFRIPVCPITGLSDPSLKSELTRRGCTALIEKPFGPGDLVEQVERLLWRESIP